MKMLTYPFLAICSLVMTAIAYVANIPACALINANGDFPKALKWWLQPPDFAELEGPDWQAHVGKWPKYLQRLYYVTRNPSQGFDQLLAAKVSYSDTCTFDGTWYRCNGYFEYNKVIPVGSMFMLISFGYRLKNIYQRYEHPTQGQIISWPIRFNKSAT